MTTETSQEQLVDIPEWVSKVRAIGIDTNGIGRGAFNLKQLQGLAHQAKQHGAMELWIAEPVIWEWADHLREDRVSLNQARTKLVAAGIELDAQPPTVEDALDYVLRGVQGLGEHVKVVSIEPVVVDAMKDQILVRSPGERVTREGRSVKNRQGKSVKTGAADSAIFRAYNHQASKNSDTYVILSGDSDVEKAHKGWGVEGVRSFSSTDALNKHIFRMIPAPEQLVASCVELLRLSLDNIDLTSFESTNNLIGWDMEDVPLVFSGTGSKLLVGLSGIKLDKVSQIVVAEACIATDVIGPDVTTDEYGFEHADPGSQRIYTDSAVNVAVTFQVAKGVATGITVGSVRYTSLVQRVETCSQDDGPLNVLHTMSAVPGLVGFDWAESFYGAEEREVVVDGDVLELSFSGTAAEDWALSATYRGEQVEIVGTMLQDGMQFENGDSIDNTVVLSTDSKFVPNHPSLAVNALIMQTPKPS